MLVNHPAAELRHERLPELITVTPAASKIIPKCWMLCCYGYFNKKIPMLQPKRLLISMAEMHWDRQPLTLLSSGLLNIRAVHINDTRVPLHYHSPIIQMMMVWEVEEISIVIPRVEGWNGVESCKSNLISDSFGRPKVIWKASSIDAPFSTNESEDSAFTKLFF